LLIRMRNLYNKAIASMVDGEGDCSAHPGSLTVEIHAPRRFYLWES
jgi:hypothetical protein